MSFLVGRNIEICTNCWSFSSSSRTENHDDHLQIHQTWTCSDRQNLHHLEIEKSERKNTMNSLNLMNHQPSNSLQILWQRMQKQVLLGKPHIACKRNWRRESISFKVGQNWWKGHHRNTLMQRRQSYIRWSFGSGIAIHSHALKIMFQNSLDSQKWTELCTEAAACDIHSCLPAVYGSWKGTLPVSFHHAVGILDVAGKLWFQIHFLQLSPQKLGHKDQISTKPQNTRIKLCS